MFCFCWVTMRSLCVTECSRGGSLHTSAGKLQDVEIVVQQIVSQNIWSIKELVCLKMTMPSMLCEGPTIAWSIIYLTPFSFQIQVWNHVWWTDDCLRLTLLCSVAESPVQRHMSEAVYLSEASHSAGSVVMEIWGVGSNSLVCLPLNHDKQLSLRSSSAAYTSSPWGSCRKTLKEQKLYQHVCQEFKWHLDALALAL